MSEEKETLIWICRCGHEVVSEERPRPIKWTDGHTCVFPAVGIKYEDWERKD